MIAPYNDYAIRNVFLESGHFPVTSFFALPVLVLSGNRIWSGVSSKLALSVCELVPIWYVMAVVCGIILEP